MIDNNIVSTFKEKAEFFNNFFAKQCTPLQNDSKLSDKIHWKYNLTISSVNIVNDDKTKLLK